MITSVRELHKTVSRPDGLFYHYLICRVVSGKPGRYHLLRIDDLCGEMKMLGNELSLQHCREIVAEHEPVGTQVTRHKVVR